MDIAYADPPYPGCAHLYADDSMYEGEAAEVDHAELIDRLESDYDGWVLHTHVPGLSVVMPLLPDGARVMAWVKPFAAFKRNVPVAYAWEPVIVKPCRKPVVEGSTVVMRDWIAEPITMQRGLTGAKPENVCRWAFEVVGATQDDELHDLYPGSGAVQRAWNRWTSETRLAI